jgi:hypothetical protein
MHRTLKKMLWLFAATITVAFIVGLVLNSRGLRFRTNLKFEIVDKQMLHQAAISGSEELFAAPKKGDDTSKWLPHAGPASPFPGNPKVSGALQLSRIGLDHTRTRGMVYYVYRCGVLCGQSGWATIRKVHGLWRLDEMGGGEVY